MLDNLCDIRVLTQTYRSHCSHSCLALFTKVHDCHAASANDLNRTGFASRSSIPWLTMTHHDSPWLTMTHHCLPGKTIFVDLAKASLDRDMKLNMRHLCPACPLTQALVVRDINNRHVLLQAQALSSAHDFCMLALCLPYACPMLALCLPYACPMLALSLYPEVPCLDQLLVGGFVARLRQEHDLGLASFHMLGHLSRDCRVETSQNISSFNHLRSGATSWCSFFMFLPRPRKVKKSVRCSWSDEMIWDVVSQVWRKRKTLTEYASWRPRMTPSTWRARLRTPRTAPFRSVTCKMQKKLRQTDWNKMKHNETQWNRSKCIKQLCRSLQIASSSFSGSGAMVSSSSSCSAMAWNYNPCDTWTWWTPCHTSQLQPEKSASSCGVVC